MVYSPSRKYIFVPGLETTKKLEYFRVLFILLGKIGMNKNLGLMITVTSVKSKKDLKRFIHLPFSIHKDHKEWLPP